MLVSVAARIFFIVSEKYFLVVELGGRADYSALLLLLLQVNVSVYVSPVVQPGFAPGVPPVAQHDRLSGAPGLGLWHWMGPRRPTPMSAGGHGGDARGHHQTMCKVAPMEGSESMYRDRLGH